MLHCTCSRLIVLMQCMCRLLPTKANQRMKQIAAEIERVLKGIVAKRENAMRSGEATSDDLLGLLLESNMAHCRDSNAGIGITTDDVIGECKLFYFAGAETTSVLLTWTMIVLCMHPEWQDRAREEVLHVFGAAGTPDYDGLSHLRVVTMVLYEVLRLYTPVTAIHRETYKPMELGGIRYPEGVVLMLPLFGWQWNVKHKPWATYVWSYVSSTVFLCILSYF
jgi:cytochrome P450